MDIQGTTALTGAGNPSAATTGLGGEDFLNLLITQLTNQDPLEPTSNEELLNQIATIRDIELSTSLSESLTGLAAQQRVSSAASLIGQYVVGNADSGAGGLPVRGVIVGVRFSGDGQALLELGDGRTLALDDVSQVANSGQAASGLIGQYVTGTDLRIPDDPRPLDGIVVGTRSEDGETLLDLDNGETLRLADVADILARSPDDDGIELGLF